jgi:hypothetical protein
MQLKTIRGVKILISCDKVLKDECLSHYSTERLSPGRENMGRGDRIVCGFIGGRTSAGRGPAPDKLDQE